MIVYFTPFFSNNPYQSALAEALKSKGAKVKFLSKLPREPWFFQNSKGARILHIHWVSPLYSWSGKTLIRFIRFVFKLTIAKILGYKIVWTAHNIIPHRRTYPVINLAGRYLIVLFADRIPFSPHSK